MSKMKSARVPRHACVARIGFALVKCRGTKRGHVNVTFAALVVRLFHLSTDTRDIH